MDKLLIVGSGASGVHFALSVLQKGYHVIMADVGHRKPATIDRSAAFDELKTGLDDPVRYFLGDEYEAVVSPQARQEYYGFPPNKSYLFKQPATFHFEGQGFQPLFSFAQGGLAEAWTGGVYPFNDAELGDFPFDYSEIDPYYSEIARRIGITGARDDLARFFPVHDNLLEPLELDRHSAQLLAAYEMKRRYLVGKLRCYLGRSRVATLSVDRDGRTACAYCGRCLWGCPLHSLYTPSLTLEELRRHPNFTYLPDTYVSYFTYDAHRRILSAVAETPGEGRSREITADRFILAAGTLSSSAIYLRSIFQGTGEIAILRGLMDNRQVLVPFLNLKMAGQTYEPRSYQYHQLAVGIEQNDPREYVHGQITTLKAALAHPIIQNMPFDLRASTAVFRKVRAGLGVVNVNFRDVRRESNYVTLKTDGASDHPRLAICYSPPAEERILIKQVLKTVKRALWSLGCVVPPGTIHVRPMGASTHYAGTVPMSTGAGLHTASRDCGSHYFDNLYFVDGTTIPSLPAKNLTFTLMANAIRVADRAF